jgi:IclR family acetate operon transcriptional repressor
MPRKRIDAEEMGKPTSAIAKAFAVIRVLRRAPSSVTLTSIAEQVGIAPSTAHSVLTELLAQGAVMQDGDKRYQLGPSLYYLGSAYARHTPVFRSIWMELVALANELAVTAAVAAPWEEHHLIIASHQAGTPDVDVAFGGRVPLDGGSWGKAYWAWSGAALPKSIQAYTAKTVTDMADYRADIERTRDRGYAIDQEEFSDGIAAVTTSVTSQAGYEGLVSLLAPASRMAELTFEQTGRRLTALAGRASLALGDSSRLTLVGAE